MGGGRRASESWEEGDWEESLRAAGGRVCLVVVFEEIVIRLRYNMGKVKQ